jgi:hypothetical protein
VILIPTSLLYHKSGGATGSYYNPRHAFLAQRNRMQCMLKNLETKNVIPGIFVLLFFSTYRMIRYLKSRTPRSALAHAQAYWWGLCNFQTILRKRMLIQNSRLVADSFLQQHGLLLSYIQSFREFVPLASARRRFPSIFDEQAQ